MTLKFLKSKLHQATVTAGRLTYHGSLTVDPELMEAVGLLPYEAILVSNLATGLRGETYVIPGRPGQREVELNGAMARLGTTGDRIIIMAFALLKPEEVPGHRPRVAILDKTNQIVELPEYPPVGPVSDSG
ncbi:MAG: aspartate 1-decarboxylase [Planctomycetota bacterium]|jgi:aspartate 1-decarboxylase